MIIFKRLITNKLKRFLKNSLVVLIVGPRRAGKTTLVKNMISHQRSYYTLDDETIRSFAEQDPTGFIRGMDKITIDEIQLVPELILPIKKHVDDNEQFGSFLLTGSANILTLPKVADSLAGRMKILRLLPLARCEILGKSSDFLDCLFHGEFISQNDQILGDDLINTAFYGGFPEVIKSANDRDIKDWADGYLEAIIHRDINDISSVEKLSEFGRFFRVLGEYSGQIVNYSKLGSSLGVSHTTGKKYVKLLEQVFLITQLMPWYTNKIKRLTKTPKIYMIDTCLLCVLRGLSPSRMIKNRNLFGTILENYVVSEVFKLINSSDMRIVPYHFTHNQNFQVDLLLERDDGMISAIEIKAKASVKAQDFKGLKILMDLCSDKFCSGVVLYDGTEVIAYGERLFAIPLSSLWGGEIVN